MPHNIITTSLLSALVTQSIPNTTGQPMLLNTPLLQRDEQSTINCCIVLSQFHLHYYYDFLVTNQRVSATNFTDDQNLAEIFQAAITSASQALWRLYFVDDKLLTKAAKIKTLKNLHGHNITIIGSSNILIHHMAGLFRKVLIFATQKKFIALSKAP